MVVTADTSVKGLNPVVLPEEEVFEKLSVLLNAAFSPAVRKVKHYAVKHTAVKGFTLPQFSTVHLEKHLSTWLNTWEKSKQSVVKQSARHECESSHKVVPESLMIWMLVAAPSCRSASSWCCRQVAVMLVSASELSQAENEKFPSPTSKIDREADIFRPTGDEAAIQKPHYTERFLHLLQTLKL